MTHQSLRLGKCWKLFRATLKGLSHGILKITVKLKET